MTIATPQSANIVNDCYIHNKIGLKELLNCLALSIAQQYKLIVNMCVEDGENKKRHVESIQIIYQYFQHKLLLVLFCEKEFFEKLLHRIFFKPLSRLTMKFYIYYMRCILSSLLLFILVALNSLNFCSSCRIAVKEYVKIL